MRFAPRLDHRRRAPGDEAGPGQEHRPSTAAGHCTLGSPGTGHCGTKPGLSGPFALCWHQFPETGPRSTGQIGFVAPEPAVDEAPVRVEVPGAELWAPAAVRLGVGLGANLAPQAIPSPFVSSSGRAAGVVLR